MLQKLEELQASRNQPSLSIDMLGTRSQNFTVNGQFKSQQI